MRNDSPSDSAPPVSDKSLQHVVSLVNTGALDQAATAALSLTDRAMSREAWRLLAQANANSQRFSTALRAIDRALEFDPGSRDLRLERALLLERDGRARESREELERLAGEAEDSPQLLVHLCRALRFEGRIAEAEARANSALERWPTDAALHRLLAELSWANGAGTRCTERLERAIDEFPEQLQLRLVAADLLRAAGAPERALPLLEEGLRRAPGATAFETSVGVLLGELDRPRDALPYLRSAAARLPGSPQMRRNLLPVLLRAGEYIEGLALAEDLLAVAPDDQQLLAYRAAALRMSGDSRYPLLQDYDRLVRSYRLTPPAGYADIQEFNSALARELLPLHADRQRPLAQSIRGGSQTERNLPVGNPVIAAFFQMLEAPIRDYIGRLDAASSHPTDRRKSANWRIAGSWSVQLMPGGFHTNHVHPQGWISSAYYVELPTADEGADPRAGWLKFGELEPAIRGGAAERHIEPEAGMLVLFPSFFWHGTVPFAHGGRRLTAAFDVVPA